MIFEQALMHLPEILAGSGYARQEYEGGIVSAFSLATLQALNGRNVANPISLMQAEKLYREKSVAWKSPAGKRRYLRADMHLDTAPLRTGNRHMAQYGWRHSNWLEAKFFRAFTKAGSPKKGTNQATHTGHLLADLLRLIALCPAGVAKKQRSSSTPETYVGRYLLHVYSNLVSDHLSTKRGGTPRAWLKAVSTEGSHSAPRFAVRDETKGVVDQIGTSLNNLEVEFSCTNLVIRPQVITANPFTYTCILTRIDSFRVIWDGKWIDHDSFWTLSSDNTKPIERGAELGEFVGGHINLKSESEGESPVIPTVSLPVDEDEFNGDE